MTVHEGRLAELMEPHDPVEDPEAEDNVYLSYMGNDNPVYVKVMWVISLAAFAWYTWVWYLPDLSMWMNGGG
jgi:hypothetical protein